MQENIFKTFGCRLNIFETEVIRSFVEEQNLRNVVILNTCAVTTEAERKAKREVQKLRNNNPSSFLIVTGCAAQLNPSFFQKMREVDLVLGNVEKLSRDSWIKVKGFQSGEKHSLNTRLLTDIMRSTKLKPKTIQPSQTKTRAFIGIQNGCDHRCTFCVIPYARGNSRSLTLKQIKEQIEHLVSSGVKEVVLTGVDITAWGADLPNPKKLGDLVECILKFIPGLPRLRISSIDSVEADTKLIKLLCEEERLMPHLHLSLQSGDNLILKRMKRRHSREDAIEFCSVLKKARPEITLSADLIAGFPTEDEEMFKNTVEVIDECKIDWLHVFPFSPRPGTPAAKMPQISRSIIEERAAQLRDISQTKLNQLLDHKIDSIQSVLVETNLKGFTKDFNKVTFPEGPKIGEIVEMRIKSHEKNELFGLPIS